MTSVTAMNQKLKHVTVLEEAHHLLKRTTHQSEGSNLAEKSVEMLTNSIAEMRTYGEGFLIVDQSPGLLDMAVIRNTNTKMIMRLPEYSDRELAGRAAALNDEQLEELSRLGRGVAAVYQNDWAEAVLCRVELVSTDDGQYKPKLPPSEDRENRDALRTEILSLAVQNKLSDRWEEIKSPLLAAPVPLRLKRSVADYCTAEPELRTEALSVMMYELLDAGAWLDSEKRGFRTYEEFRETALLRLPSLCNGEYAPFLNQILSLILYEAQKNRADYYSLWDECTRCIKGGGW